MLILYIYIFIKDGFKISPMDLMLMSMNLFTRTSTINFKICKCLFNLKYLFQKKNNKIKRLAIKVFYLKTK